MNLISKYRIIIAIVLPALILLTVRTCTTGSFKYDAKKWSASSFDHSNIISKSDIGKLSGEKLIVYLDNSYIKSDQTLAPEVRIPADSILIRKYLNKIRNHKGPVMIYSADPALSARIWMLISQTGCRNLYILANGNDNESFKNEFRPDTMIKPEL